MWERLFGLDAQLIFDAVVLAVNIFILFLVASYNLFEPVRDLLKKRQERIQGELDFAAKEKANATNLKSTYEDKIKNISAEADEILRDARKEAMKNSEQIIAEAKEEAGRIVARANNQIQLERKAVADDIKQEIIQVATNMASKIIEESLDEKKSATLIADTLNEIGEGTWQS